VTDLMHPVADRPEATPDATQTVPPPPRPTDPAPAAGHPRPPRRFLAGMATGVAVSALTVGGVALIDRSGDDGPAGDPPPAAAAPSGAEAPTATGGASPAAPPAVTLVPEGSSVHDLVVAVRPSIVAIHTTVSQTDFFGQRVRGEAAGSGFVWSADGYVITNNHVIEGAVDIMVTFGDGSSEPAELVAADPRSDLAVLSVDRDDLVPLAIGDSDEIRVGDPVVAIGNALDLGAEPTVTGGMLSAKDRTIETVNGVLVHLLQTDAAISSGNSGGPLLDLNGRVVGINTAVASRGQNIGFAIAINPAERIIESLRTGEAPRHALLGVSARPTIDGSDGALVAAVESGSGADRAGIRPGDVITRLGDTRIDSPSSLVAAISSREPGAEVEVELDRDGETIVITALLGAQDEMAS
jgi:S1-C subfamily serine protease